MSLTIRVKKDEKIFIELDGKKFDIIVKGKQAQWFALTFNAPKEIKIKRENAINKEPKEQGNELQ